MGTKSVPTLLRARWNVEARLRVNLLRVTLVFAGKPAPTARRLGLALPFTHNPRGNLHSCPADTHRKGLEDRHTLSTLSDGRAVDLSSVPDSHQARLRVGQSRPVVWVGQCFFYCMSTQYCDLDI